MIRVLADYRELVEESGRDGDTRDAFAVLARHLEGDRYVDLMPSIREYVVCVGMLHEETRRLLVEELASAEQEIADAGARLRKVATRNPVGLYIARVDDQGRPEAVEWVSGDFVERRRELVAKNRTFDAVSRTYVASMDVASGTG